MTVKSSKQTALQLLLVSCCCCLLLALQTTAAPNAATLDSGRQQQISRAHHRRLMQPFNLGIQDAGDRTGRVNQREIDDLTSAAVIIGIDRAGTDSKCPHLPSFKHVLTLACDQLVWKI